ncbi:hypothetical protein GCM10020295_16130 [Streptomyces cinereospinus]
MALEEEFVMDDIEEERTAGLRTVADVEDLIVGLHKPAALAARRTRTHTTP